MQPLGSDDYIVSGQKPNLIQTIGFAQKALDIMASGA